jgi:hypothetical protein
MTTTAIRTVHLPTPIPRGREAPAPALSGAYVTEEKNSRWTRGAPRGAFEVAGRAGLGSEIDRGFVGGSTDGFLVAGGDQVALFDPALKPVASLGLSGGSVAMDAAAALWLAADPFGAIAARRWSDAGRAYLVRAAYGRSYRHEVLGKHGGGWYVLSTELPPVGDDVRGPKFAAVTKIDPGESDRTDGDGFRLSARQARVYRFERADASGAFHEGRTYLAYPDHVVILSADLAPAADLTGAFVPLGISLDESGRIYLLVRVGAAHRLWIVTAEGDRILDFELPRDFVPDPRPPVVGYNHVAYVVGGRSVLAISPDGKLEWKTTFGGQIAGAVATTDDEVVVAAGPQIVALDSKGSRRILAELDGETLATAPSPLGDRDLVIASRKSLFRLTPKPEAAR